MPVYVSLKKEMGEANIVRKGTHCSFYDYSYMHQWETIIAYNIYYLLAVPDQCLNAMERKDSQPKFYHSRMKDIEDEHTIKHFFNLYTYVT